MSNKATKKILIIAMLSALAVAGRIALISVPQVKPVLAIIILAGSVYGSLSGAAVGAITMFCSNMFMGQGIWTIWQIIAAAVVGFASSFIPRKNRLAFAVIGALLTWLVYGTIMNIGSVYMFQNEMSLAKILAFCISGLPFDITHSLSTFAFILAMDGKVRTIMEKYK
ncbi:MAG: ECF transporter S component [Clostridiales bacterium]|jgi:energy-coupling factor transport system substrate-specific component|nr:ECF transporter S component [Clostridiales bacterium]